MEANYLFYIFTCHHKQLLTLKAVLPIKTALDIWHLSCTYHACSHWFFTHYFWVKRRCAMAHLLLTAKSFGTHHMYLWSIAHNRKAVLVLRGQEQLSALLFFITTTMFWLNYVHTQSQQLFVDSFLVVMSIAKLPDNGSLRGSWYRSSLTWKQGNKQKLQNEMAAETRFGNDVQETTIAINLTSKFVTWV